MPPVKIYVGNVPSSARSSELKELFEKFGKVVECDILKDFGFVHMDDTNDAKAAIAGLNDTLWKGARVRVEISTTRTNKGEPSQRRKIRAPFSQSRMGGSSRHRHEPMHRSGSSSRGGPPMPSHHRDGPYGAPPPPMHRSSRSSGGGGPIRGSERRGGYESSNGGRYMPERGRPYPDAYDHRGSNGRAMPPSPLPPPRGDYGPPSSSYRGGSGDMRDHRNGLSNGGSMSDSYMRAGHFPPPAPHHMAGPGMHDSYYRGPPPPPPPHGMPPSRYDYDHYRGPPPPSSSSRGRYNR